MAGLLNKETGGMPMQVAAQFIGLASVLAWSVCWSLAIWLPCKWMGTHKRTRHYDASKNGMEPPPVCLSVCLSVCLCVCVRHHAVSA